MRLTEDRISHISHIIADGIWKNDLVDFTNDAEAIREIKKVIANHMKIEDEADDAAREKIRSMSKQIPEGSREWDVLYKKYYEEEIDKKRF